LGRPRGRGSEDEFVGGVGSVRVAPAVIQPGRVGGGVTGGVLDGREALSAVEQHRDERVPEAVGVHPVDLAVCGAEQPGAAGELDQQPADGLLGVGDARSVVAVAGAPAVLALEQHATVAAAGDSADGRETAASIPSLTPAMPITARSPRSTETPR
jgi:hypothetical protein